MVNEYNGKNSKQGGNELCNAIHENIGVSPVDNQSVFNVGGHIDLFIWGLTSLSTLYRSYHDG